MELTKLLAEAKAMLEKYDDAGSLGQEYQSDKLCNIIRDLPQAIETVRAMQEALRSLYARCQAELADPEDVPEMHDAFAALRRAEGSAG